MTMTATLTDFVIEAPSPLVSSALSDLSSPPAKAQASADCQPSTRSLQWNLAFTLIEVCIAMAVGILILTVAVLGIGGIQSEHELKDTAAGIESNARGMLLKAVSEHRTMQMPFTGIGSGNVEIKRYGEKKYRKPNSDEQWEFSATGICEPIDVRITSERGTIEMSFDPLTACARKKNIIVNKT